MKRKRLTGLLLAAAMTAVVCLGGCGDSKNQDSASGGEKSDQTESKQESQEKQESESVQGGQEALEEKTIQVWLGGPGKQKDSDEVWAEFNKLLQQYVPNTTVEFTVFPTSEYKEKYNQMLASGEGVDLAWIANWVTGSTNENIKDGNLMELNDLLDTYGQGIKEALGDTILDFHREKDGGLYYLICNQGLSTEKRAFWLPTELVELAGDGWLEETKAVVDKWYTM